MSLDYDAMFSGIRRLYGASAYQKIASSRFCVVGIGGVGSWVVEALARTGVAAITLIDHDDISVGNTNRQIHTSQETIGAAKVDVMAQRVGSIHPQCEVDAIDDFLTSKNIQRYMSQNFDYVIDAIDGIRFKTELAHYCRRNKIPFVMTGGAGGLTDPTAIQVTDLSKTYNDPLAAKVRAKLRSEFNYSRDGKKKFGIDCVFSSQQQLYPRPDGTVSTQKPGVHGVTLDCESGYGSATFVTASFGFVAVSHAISKMLARAQRAESR
ncbi:MAG: tRNA cyclic N6-threonylcarbamoyladenosine(37) synthase TcdA [Gammaproteobacteria bacterium]|nr:tRNA cyclic N6-threonylcarbamoyladenosine(37) synthase TcdA [Gammaproteobacteria bacterium]